MSKENNLTDFLTDVADAIREKKGTTEKINPQDFSDEIKGIKTSSSFWTGHVDVEGLKAIGWDDEDIAYYQEHGVNWNEEDDEYYKVSDDNKALYGVLTADNIQEYKDRIVWLPKIDWSETIHIEAKFKDCMFMKGMPSFNKNSFIGCTSAFVNCFSITCIPPIDISKSSYNSSAFRYCYSLQYLPPLNNFENTITARYIFSSCFSMTELPAIDLTRITEQTGTEGIYYQCRTLRKVVGEINALNKVVSFSYCHALTEVKIRNLSTNINLSMSAPLSSSSLLFMIENEAATSTITITLYVDAYARLSTDPDIIAALENHPLVSLASA